MGPSNTFKRVTVNWNISKIVSFQDNFKFMGDLPFIVYFDFETMTGDSVINDKKMFVISYCQIFAFNPSLNLQKIVVLEALNKILKRLLL